MKSMAPAVSINGADDVENSTFFGRGFEVAERKLQFNGHAILSDVPSNVFVSPYFYNHRTSFRFGASSSKSSVGAFLGFNSGSDESRHVMSLGKLKSIQFTSIFRFKLWWTTQWVGNCGSDLETETQMLLLDTRSKAAANGCPEHPYILILPIYEGKFRASLQPGKHDNVDVCVESGSTSVRQATFKTCVYLHAGRDPFILMKEAVKAVRAHLGSFRHLDEKTPPAILDKFGWCTWDAFYLTVHPEGVWNGVKGFVEGGVPLRFMILDDGWQSIGYDDQDPSDDATHQTVAGDQMRCRLTSVRENSKFKNYAAGTLTECSKSCIPRKKLSCNTDRLDKVQEHKHLRHTAQGMGAFIQDLKSEFKLLDDVYVWHALTGYWGGVRPGVPDSCNSRLVKPALAPGVWTTMEDLAVDKLVTNTIGLVPPESVHEFYDQFHSYLAKNGITGVKLDVIEVLEMLSEQFGGRVELAKTYYDALSASMRKNFGGNRVLASMEHCNDFMLLGTEQISMGRVGDDFWPCAGSDGDLFWIQGVHMVHCAYNSLWMGQFIHPDWDMFQTKHETATFHAASRAISGGPIYVSDKPGQHDFDLLRKMVLPDGTILRCTSFALPTLDCLFRDPLQDGETVLKIWNHNKCGGVVGAFNCQGGGWSKEERRTRAAEGCRVACRTVVRASDVQWNQATHPFAVAAAAAISSATSEAQGGDAAFAVLNGTTGHVSILHGLHASIQLELEPLQFEIYTVVPVTRMVRDVEFAALGLVNMLNAGGAVQHVTFSDISEFHVIVHVDIRGSGQFVAYASTSPHLVMLNNANVMFSFLPSPGRILLDIPWNPPCGSSTLTFAFDENKS